MVPIDPDPQELTSYVLGELPPDEFANFEAVLRGDADLRGKAEDTIEVVDALASGLRIGPGGLSESQRNAVFDHLDTVLSGESTSPSVDETEPTVASLEVTDAAKRSAYFSPRKAFNTAAIAAGVIFVVGGAFFLGVFNSGLADKMTSAKGGSLLDELESNPMVASAEENGYEMRVRLSLPDKVTTSESLLASVDGSRDDKEKSERASWEAWLADVMSHATHSAEAATVEESAADPEGSVELAENEELAPNMESDGFRVAKVHGVSAVPVVAGSDFYETLWTNVRRESRLPERDIVAVEQLVNYFPYSYPEPAYGERLSVSVETGECPWNASHALVRVGIRGRDVPGGGSDEVVASDLGVVADFNAAMVKSYRLIGYSRCSQDAAIGGVIHDAETGADLHSNQTVTALYEVVPLQLDEVDKNREVSRRSDMKERGVHHPVGLYAGIFDRDDESSDLLSVRLIYRVPGTLQHEKEVVSVPPVMKLWRSLDDDFRFAAAVAGFGLRLKGDLPSDTLNYERIERLAKGALGRDHDGRRAEFLALVKQVKSLPECPEVPREMASEMPVLASPRR